MKVLKNPWWWLAVVAFVVHQGVQWGLGVHQAYVDAYLDPLLAMPVLLGLWLLERQLIFRVQRLQLLETAVATVLLSVLLEEVFPRYEPGFRHDAVDYVFYALGGVYFYLFINK